MEQQSAAWKGKNANRMISAESKAKIQLTQDRAHLGIWVESCVRGDADSVQDNRKPKCLHIKSLRSLPFS